MSASAANLTPPSQPAPTGAERATVDYWAVVAGIERSIAETRKFGEERDRLAAEREKLQAEALKLARDRTLAPWQLVAAATVAVATLLGASAGVAALVARWVAGG